MIRSFVRAAAVVLGAALVSPAAAVAQDKQPGPTKAMTKLDVKAASPVQGFSVVLLLGDVQGGPGSTDAVPPAARKALADMKDFLPYKTYRMLDTAWILGSSRAMSHVRGAEDQDYELNINTWPIGLGADGKALRVDFVLREGGDATSVDKSDAAAKLIQMSQLTGRRAALEDELRTADGKKDADVAAKTRQLDMIKQQLAELDRRDTARRSIINTSFTMDVGETVVVGTSRLRGGDKALIALLTVVPRSR